MSAPPSPHSPGGATQRERHGIHGRDDERTVRARPARQRIDVLQLPEEVRLLDDDRGDVLAGERRERIRIDAARRGIVRHGFELQALASGHHLGDATPRRVDSRRHEDARRLRAPVRAHGHEAGLGERGGAVVERRVRHIQRGQARDHGLVLVHDLQRALARLGLVRRVGAVDLAARDEGPDGRRNVVLVGAGADEVERQAVARRARAGEPGHIHFRQCLGHTGQRSRCEAPRESRRTGRRCCRRRCGRASRGRPRTCAGCRALSLRHAARGLVGRCVQRIRGERRPPA